MPIIFPDAPSLASAASSSSSSSPGPRAFNKTHNHQDSLRGKGARLYIKKEMLMEHNARRYVRKFGGENTPLWLGLCSSTDAPLRAAELLSKAL